jgi:4-amino-4-deoxy-L-arabinose transferase-like glycosyltransferase
MDNPNIPPHPQEEPSILDYIKQKLSPWKAQTIKIPKDELPSEKLSSQLVSQEEPSVQIHPEIQAPPERKFPWKDFPWRSLVALGLALFAQYSLEPRLNRSWTLGVILYLLSLGWLIWALRNGEWQLAPQRDDERSPDSGKFRLYPLIASGVFSLLAFLGFSGNLFTAANEILWIAAVAFFIAAFWTDLPDLAAWRSRLVAFLKQPHWNFSFSRDTLLVLGIFLVVVFFRTYQLQQVPPEMISDHAEKLLDVYDVLHQQPHIFFPRNTGREAFQFYLIALTAKLFGTGLSFLTMKIGTVLCGLLTLLFIYLLGKEIANRRAGLLAMLFAGIAYWPNVISRLALRFTLYPFFVAPTLYYLIRGLRTSKRNDFIIAGLILGLGLHTYTPIRILPLVVLAAFFLYLIHRQSGGVRKITLQRLVILVLAAFIVFLPLFRYATENPEMFALRTFTRLSSWERPLPGPAGVIFLKNLWNAMVMFGWNDGTVWASSVPYRPALDVITAVFLYLGMALVLIRYLLRRHWLDIFLLLSVPLLMLPSILSLAFPEENPNLSRTGGALVPVFIIVGLSIDGFMHGITKKLPAPAGKRLAYGSVIFLFILSSFQNYNLVFKQYQNGYLLSSWNTSEMGQVVKNFSETLGSPDNVWLVGYPYWADSRLVGINSGYPAKDYGIFPEQLEMTKDQAGAKLFLIYPGDENTVAILKELYPDGWLQVYDSTREGKDFWMYFVPTQ